MQHSVCKLHLSSYTLLTVINHRSYFSAICNWLKLGKWWVKSLVVCISHQHFKSLHFFHASKNPFLFFHSQQSMSYAKLKRKRKKGKEKRVVWWMPLKILFALYSIKSKNFSTRSNTFCFLLLANGNLALIINLFLHSWGY